MELYTTFRLAERRNACIDRYKHFAKSVGGVKRYGEDTPIPLAKVLEVNGLEDALWCLRAVPEEQEAERDRLARLFACDCAEHVLHFYEVQYPEDKRPHRAIEVSRRYAQGMASREELVAARAARAVAEVAEERQWQVERFRQYLQK